MTLLKWAWLQPTKLERGFAVKSAEQAEDYQ